MSDQVLSRTYAGVFDIPVKGDSDNHGINPSPDAIGGYEGMAWYQYFRDTKTGEVYCVRCSDGINGGKSAHSDEDEAWRQAIYAHVVRRSHEQAKAGLSEIRISRNERVCMQGFTHAVWLESREGARDGAQSTEGLEGGLVGSCHGVPVICDPAQQDDIPPPPVMGRREVVFVNALAEANPLNPLSKKLLAALNGPTT